MSVFEQFITTATRRPDLSDLGIEYLSCMMCLCLESVVVYWSVLIPAKAYVLGHLRLLFADVAEQNSRSFT